MTRTKMLKPTILSISMATVMAGAAISPALGLIAQAFPEASPTMIKLILTAPSIMIIPFSFLSSYLTSKITKRMIILIGLLIYLIGGIGPQFVSTIESILMLRLILGAGVGLVMPLSMTLINDYFIGRERTKMMGFNSAFSNFGGIITMLLAGWLATFSWRVPFNVYWLGLFIIILIFFFLPKGEIQKPQSLEKKAKLPLAVYGYALAMGGVMLAYYSIATNIALYLEQSDLGDAALAGTIVSFTTVGGMITSLLLVQIEVIFNKFVIPVMLFGMAAAFLFLSFTHSIPLIVVSVCLIGFGQGAIFPTIILQALNQVKPYLADRVIAWTSSMTFLGQFLSPVILDGIGKMANQGSIRFQYGVLSASVLFFVVLSSILIARNRKQDFSVE
ncbi:MFS transporter [Sporosarcina newyorkensis]|uniref:Cyanate permease n=1 Tax=Sporosarcina newyorkensis TaxID=759851 RepID=A0A1T4YIK0_9BACL|nr:MFS transporter [Sporosarcina newyorkensis]SKB01520.1 Cyanate permease [Sporosarcina newyorkensis]